MRLHLLSAMGADHHRRSTLRQAKFSKVVPENLIALPRLSLMQETGTPGENSNVSTGELFLQ